MSHNREVSGPLVASFLLDLLDHYSPKAVVKTINITLLKSKFLLILSGQNFNQSNDIVCVNGAKVRPCSMYEHYAHRGLLFENISIYEYFRFVFIVKRSQQQSTDYEFDKEHGQKENFVQRPLQRIDQLILVVLCGNLSENKESEDAVPGGHPETDARRTDLSLIFLSLFILWNHLLSLLLAEGATLATYKEFCWKVWAKCEPTLPSHVKFYAQNICQMRKTRIEVKTDIIARADAREAARLAADDWCDETTNMADINDEVDINSANIDLGEFGVLTQTSLADSVRETHRRWSVEDYTNSSQINVITSLILNPGVENANHMEESLLIRRYQVVQVDCPDIGDINNIDEDIVSSWQELIRRSGKLPEEEVDIDHIQDLSS